MTFCKFFLLYLTLFCVKSLPGNGIGILTGNRQDTSFLLGMLNYTDIEINEYFLEEYAAILSERKGKMDIIVMDDSYGLVYSKYFQNLSSITQTKLKERQAVPNNIAFVPFRKDLGVLFYRKDLCNLYGLDCPPKTFVELENLAYIIQKKQRKDHVFFEGWVWQGAKDETLSCIFNEWFVSSSPSDGVYLIDENKSISVNSTSQVEKL